MTQSSTPDGAPEPKHVASSGGAAAKEMPESGWLVFDQQVVVLQLAEPYVGIAYPAEVMVDEEGKLIRTSLLRGILRVAPSEAGILLILQVVDPKEGTISFITVHPKDVAHCTHVERIEQPRIVAP